jgi:ABC-type nickel/cobalt efflux system permease component RcnA
MMVETEITFSFLLATAVSIGFVHTLIGVDHSLVFIVIGKARNWPLKRVLGLTALCGLGHVLSSVVLGYAGIGLGVAIQKLEWIESSRGELAANLLIGFGLAYGCRALWKALRNKEHAHEHSHAGGIIHSHQHNHHRDHTHAHEMPGKGITAWSLFIIFVLGPCEPLIPILMAPAAEHHWLWVFLIATAFGITTIGTMLAVVAAGFMGLKFIRVSFLERFGNVFAGFAIAGSGLAIQLLGI